jgi:hypothetical protein
LSKDRPDKRVVVDLAIPEIVSGDSEAAMRSRTSVQRSLQARCVASDLQQGDAAIGTIARLPLSSAPCFHARPLSRATRTPRVHSLHREPLQQLVHLGVRHLLPQLRQDVAQFARADEAVARLVEYLEALDELL